MLRKESRLASGCLIVLVPAWVWCRIADSNRGLLHYECNALPTELIRPSTQPVTTVREDTDYWFRSKVRLQLSNLNSGFFPASACTPWCPGHPRQ